MRVELTPDGGAAIAEVPAVLASVMNAHLAGFSKTEWMALKGYLKRVVQTGEALRATWTWPSARVLRRVRALSPVPGLGLELEGLPLSVTRAEPTNRYPSALEPGEAAVYGDPATLVLRTGDGAIAITRAVLETADDEPVQLLDRQELATTAEGS